MGVYKKISLLVSVALLASCGGAPDYPEEGGTDNEDLVTVEHVPSSSGISLVYEPYVANTRYYLGTPVELTAQLKTIVGQSVLSGTEVEFVSPNIGTLEESSCSIEGVACSVTWVSEGGGHPVAHVLAMARGFEHFTDVNSNGMYDEGETFIDIGEPFLSIVDDGVISVADGEYFKDLDGDGVWDEAGNGKWDGPCSITTMACGGDSYAVIFNAVQVPLCPEDVTDIVGCDKDAVPATE